MLEKPFLPTTEPNLTRESVYFALGEIDALCKKAARGAGFSWGLAEEAGQATRWLSAYHLPSCEILAKILPTLNPLYLESKAPILDIRNNEYHIYCRGNSLCPIMSGATISDFTYILQAGYKIITSVIDYPLFIVPFLGRAAENLQQNLKIQMVDTELILTPLGLGIDGTDFHSLTQSSLEKTETLICTFTQQQPKNLIQPELKACPIYCESWKILTKFYMKTTVPENDISRLTGAGAGINDND